MEQYELVEEYGELISRAPHLQEDIELYEEPFLFFVNGKPTMIGEVRLSSMDIYVKNLCSLESGKGNGRVFVDYLQQRLHKDGVIMGESTIHAFSFWQKMGARFDSIVHKNYLLALEQEQELDGDTIIPFMIHKRKIDPLD